MCSITERGGLVLALARTTKTSCPRLLIVIQQGGSVFKPYKILLETTLHEESHLKVLRLIESNPRMSQRDLAVAMGVSLGKTNYCIKALLDKGLIKMQNFRNSQNKLTYAYLLTPAGVEEKTCIAMRFLKYKMQEYERLHAEILELQREEVEQEGLQDNEHK
ncbi:MAG TPA: MarR family EPS-associated transcriptional regulator [Methylobacter sp.]